MIYKKNKLNFDSFNIESIAKKFDTPIYCYSFRRIKENILDLINMT